MRTFIVILIISLFSNSAFSQKESKLVGTWKFEKSLISGTFKGTPFEDKSDVHIIDTLIFKSNGFITIFQIPNPEDENNQFNYSYGDWKQIDSKILITRRKTDSNIILPDTQFKVIKLNKSKLIIEFAPKPLAEQSESSQIVFYREVFKRVK